MLIWHHGSMAVAKTLGERLIPVDDFLASVESRIIPRVPGAAVFVTRTLSGTPPVMAWHVKHNRALHQYLFDLRVETQSVPSIKESERLSLTELAPNFWREEARYGFMEKPDIAAGLMTATRFRFRAACAPWPMRRTASRGWG